MKTIKVSYNTSFSSKEEQDMVYCGCDSAVTFALYPVLKKKAKELGRYHTYQFRRELLGPYLYGATRRGCKVDLNVRNSTRAQLMYDLEVYTRKFSWATEIVFGEPVNWQSSVQLKKLFYEKMLLAPRKKFIKKENRSSITVGEDALKSIIKNSPNFAPFAQAVLDLRNLKKRSEAFDKELRGDRFLYVISPVGTYTGRAASYEHPLRYGSNHQNQAPYVRGMFIPDKDKIFVYADLKSAESFAVGHISGCEKYIEACRSGDIHSYVASLVYGCEPTKEAAESLIIVGTETARQMGKVGGHATNYHSRPNVVAANAGVPIKVIEQFQETYFEAFPELVEWHNWCFDQAQMGNTFVTPFGFECKFHGFADVDLEKVIAFCPQSTVAYLIHKAALSIWNDLDDDDSVQILSNQHDALLLQLTKGTEDDILPLIGKHMTIDLPVKDIHGVERIMTIPCDFKVGTNWQEYHHEKAPNGQLYEYSKWKEIRKSAA